MNAPQTVTDSAAIRAAGLTKRYGKVLAVDGLTLEIGSGQFFGLLGPNGSGKTTTIHMLATLIQPNAGSAQVAGFDIGRNPVKAREAIGIVFQESALDRTLTVAENLRFAGLLQNLPPRTILERSRELLELFGLNIANRRRIWRFIERLRAHNAMTVLLTTHYLEEADGCDRVSFIRKGRLVESGAPRALVDDLGKHILEVEGADIERLAARLEPRLGPCLCDGDVATFRWAEEDVTELLKLQSELGVDVHSWRVRRPNLNDVFLWVAGGKGLRS